MQRLGNALEVDQVMAVRLADSLKDNGFPDAQVRQFGRGYTVEAAVGQFVIIQLEETVEQRIKSMC